MQAIEPMKGLVLDLILEYYWGYSSELCFVFSHAKYLGR
jgi:hypothetical protein